MIGLAHPDDLANFFDRTRLEDCIYAARVISGWRANVAGADDRLEPIRQIGG